MTTSVLGSSPTSADAPSVTRTTSPAPTAFDSLLDAAVGGDERAFAALVEPLLPRLDGYLRAQAREAAEDLRSDVLLAIHAGLPRFAGTEGQFRSWAFTIAHHRIVDHRRRLRPTVALDEMREGQVPSDPSSAESLAVANQRLEELCAVLEALPESQRQVLLLRTVADLSIEQTAAAVGRSTGAVKLLQHRAVRSLRRILVEDQEV